MQNYNKSVTSLLPPLTEARPPVPGEEDAPPPDAMANRTVSLHRGNSVPRCADATSRPSDATPRRSNLERPTGSQCSDDAPLGFEPEGSATGSPPFTEHGTPPCCRWARSLKQLLADRDGVRLFKQFLDQEQCSAALDFWFACNGLKIVPAADGPRIHSLVRLIYKKYVKDRQLSLRAEVRRSIADRLRQGQVDQSLFNDAQRDVEAAMRSESYPLFLKSDLYLQYVQNECDSPKSTGSGGAGCAATEPAPQTPVTAPGGLPTLHEGEELKDEDIERSATNTLALTPSALIATRHQRESMSFKKPDDVCPPAGNRLPNPYHVSYAPVSAQDSELQSLSSDALTDDTMSHTDSSVDGRGDIPFGSKKWYKHRRAVRHNAELNRRTDLNQHLIPRTQRGVSKDRDLAEREPNRFATMLMERLQKVKENLENLARVEHSIKAIEVTTEEEVESQPPVAPPGVQPASVGSLGALIATALDVGGEEENAQSILEEHVSRVWDNSVVQTPSRSPPARHEPDFRASSFIARPSPNVSASFVGVIPPASSAPRKRKERDAYGISTASLSTSYDERSSDSRHKHVHHHHYHHHQGAARAGWRGREPDANTTAPAAIIPYCMNSSNFGLPTVPPGGWPDDRMRAAGAKRNPMPNVVSTNNLGVTSAKKASGSSSNKDSGIGMLYDLVPNMRDPANEKVLAWMKENDHVATGTAHYSTDNSDKGSSHKHSSHKQSSGSAGGSSKKGASYGNRSASLDRSFSRHHQTAAPMASTCYGQQVLPSQPFAQDPLMPLLEPPNPTVQLEEARRRLQDEATSKARILKSKSFTAVAPRERRSMPPPQTSFASGHARPPTTTNNVPQVAPLDLSSSEEHSSGSAKSEKRSSSSRNKSNDVTVIGYYFCGEPIPYRSTVPGRNITLWQFKQLLTKKGNYRYFFKKACDEFDSGVVQEEVTADDAVLPLWEGKVVCKVERVE